MLFVIWITVRRCQNRGRHLSAVSVPARFVSWQRDILPKDRASSFIGFFPFRSFFCFSFFSFFFFFFAPFFLAFFSLSLCSPFFFLPLLLFFCSRANFPNFTLLRLVLAIFNFDLFKYTRLIAWLAKLAQRWLQLRA